MPFVGGVGWGGIIYGGGEGYNQQERGGWGFRLYFAEIVFCVPVFVFVFCFLFFFSIDLIQITINL